MKIKIIVIDDHAMVASGLAKELDEQDDFQVMEVVTSPAQIMGIDVSFHLPALSRYKLPYECP